MTQNRYGNLALTKQRPETPSLLCSVNHDKGSTMKHTQLSQIIYIYIYSKRKRQKWSYWALDYHYKAQGGQNMHVWGGHVGVQVKRGRHRVHVAPLDILEITVVLFLDTSCISGYLSMACSQPRSHFWFEIINSCCCISIHTLDKLYRGDGLYNLQGSFFLPNITHNSGPPKVCNCMRPSAWFFFPPLLSLHVTAMANTQHNWPRGQDLATDNESQRLKRSAGTYITGIPSTLWGPMCMSETVISLVWVSKKVKKIKKTLSEMQDRPTTTHYSTSSSTNKQETMRFLIKQWGFFLLWL